MQTLLDASRKQTLSEVVDIDLSKEEDSVTTLAVAQSTESSVTALVGINSSSVDQNAGNNEHLRSFSLEYPQKRRVGTDVSESTEKSVDGFKGETRALGRVSYFEPSSATKIETYQRVLRLSQTNRESHANIGAVATGLAPEGEIVFFNAATSSPGRRDIRGRIRLGKGEEAADVDIVQLDGEDYLAAYCTDYEVYLSKVSGGKWRDGPLETTFVHGTPHPDTFASTKARPKFRFLYFLAPCLLLLLQNQPNRSGVELLLMELPASPTPSGGIVILRKRLHRAIKSATAFSVTLLNPSSSQQNTQAAIAIAGADLSITILTLDYPTCLPLRSPKFRSHSFLKNAHSLQMTSLAFSIFHYPTTPRKDTPPQYLKLASTSIASTVVIHTLPLTPYPQPTRSSPKHRYVLSSPGRSEIAQLTFSLFISAFAIALGAFLLQAFTEIRGGTPEYLGAKGWLSERVHGFMARPYMFENLTVEAPSSIPTRSLSGMERAAEEKVEQAVQDVKKTLNLKELLSSRRKTSDEGHATSDYEILVHSSDDGESLSANILDSDKNSHGQAKKWEEMEEQEREKWKQRLVEAGEWTVEEGEAVLKGVFFSSLAGMVGAAARG